MSNPITTKPGRMSSKISMWENAFNHNHKAHSQTKQKVTMKPHKMCKLFENGKRSIRHLPKHERTGSISFITTDQLQPFSNYGEKHFKILSESIAVYKDKLMTIRSQQISFHKDEIVAGTYINHKIILLSKPHNVYCAASNVEPQDINHMTATYDKQCKKFDGMLNNVQQQLDDITNKCIVHKQERKEQEPTCLSEDGLSDDGSNKMNTMYDSDGEDIMPTSTNTSNCTSYSSSLGALPAWYEHGTLFQ